MALPRSSLVGRPLGGPPPGRGEARLKPCAAAAEGRAAGPMDARALAFLPFAPCTGEGPGLGLEGGLSEDICVLVELQFWWCGLCYYARVARRRKEERKKKQENSFLFFSFFFCDYKMKRRDDRGGRRRVGIVQ